MHIFGATEGLSVSWWRFKSSDREGTGGKFFEVPTLAQKALIDQLLENYDKLDEDIGASHR